MLSYLTTERQASEASGGRTRQRGPGSIRLLASLRRSPSPVAGCRSSKLHHPVESTLRFISKRLASSDDDGSVRDAGVPAGVSDCAAPFGIGGGRSSTATCCLQAQAAAPQAEAVRSPVLGGRSSDLDQLAPLGSRVTFITST